MNPNHFTSLIWFALLSLGGWVTGQEKAKNPVPVEEAQMSWKLATDQATTADMITVPEGFMVELVRSAHEDEGSWITLEFDDRNQLYVAKEDQGILKFTLDSNGQLINRVIVNEDLAQPRGLLWAHNSLYVNSNNPNPPPMKVLENSDGLFRLQDENGDGIFEKKTKLLETSQGSPGHGRNQLRLGPDGLIYFMSGYDVFLTKKVDKRSFLKNFAEDQVIPNPWDDDWFNKHGMAPGGHLMRMDANGSFFQLIAGGFRNPMDIAFNEVGEIFTYDADMEWDAALAWYKPTRILHVVSGADYGWRRGTGKLPVYYEDSLPAAVDVGLGSPTGLDFGYTSKFPKKWRNALFTGDWTYGRIIAVHLNEKGSSFGGEFETFAAGRPMNVVDLTFGPDGNLYFVTGGMKTKSGIYRIKWVGENEPESAPVTVSEPSKEAQLRNLRYQLEFFQVIQSPKGVQLAMQHINNADDFIRHAARIALENQDPSLWVDQALSGSSPAAFVALARAGDAVPKGRLVQRMNQIDLENMAEKELLGILRAYQIEFARNGMPSIADRTGAIGNLSPLFPHSSHPVNHELAELLVFLEDPAALPKLSELIDKAESTEDLSQYLVYARYLQNGWDIESKRTFLKGIQRLETFPGGKFHQKIVDLLRSETVAKLSNPEQIALAKWIAPLEVPGNAILAEPAAFVKAWTVDDFISHFTGELSGRNYESGKNAYSKANCARCHRMDGNQQSLKGILGPDLTQVGGRFGIKDLLVSIIDPSQAINDKYRNPAAPNLSTMPPGQINVLTKDEVLDLLAYLQAAGKPTDRVFTAKVSKKPDIVTETTSPTKPTNSGSGLEIRSIVPEDKLTMPVSLNGMEVLPSYFEKMSAANNADRVRLYKDLQGILEMQPNATFEFIGHADDTQYSQTNLDISLNRAKYAAQDMIHRGIPKTAITYKAVGDKEPSPKGNRRIEIIVKAP